MATRIHDTTPAKAIGQAMRLIPAHLHPLIGCEFVTGVDPVFAGIHSFVETRGHRYADTAHCVYDFHQDHRPRSERGVKVVLPSNRNYGWDSWQGVKVVIHELGHVLHERIGFAYVAEPITEYAHTNHHEAFAEAFAGWVWGETIDPRTTALFGGL